MGNKYAKIAFNIKNNSLIEKSINLPQIWSMLKTYGSVKYPMPRSAARRINIALALLSLNFLMATPAEFKDLKECASLPQWKSKTSSSLFDEELEVLC